MEVTQSYARPSSASLGSDGLKMNVSAELSRPGVKLDAQIKDSLSYARVMLALWNVVSSDLRGKQKDHSAYQKWVQERYLEELEEARGAQLRGLPRLIERQKELRARQDSLMERIRPLEAMTHTAEFYACRRKYFDWLAKNDWSAWLLLDPVVSVHPDAVIFEVFSLDESSYGRVTVPFEKLDTFGDVCYGTTNVDYSRAMADEIRRVRSYRPAFLSVAAEGVAVATGAGERVEKKIDLPPTWVKGFLQCQSAAVYPGIDVTLSPATVASMLSVLQRRREREGPRSLKLILTPGERPRIIVEPWNIEIVETDHVFTGDEPAEIRLWGRRRLLTFVELLPYADRVDVRLLGTGLPSYWSVSLMGHRFDLGLSGWTKNDWSSAARFDLLAAVAPVTDGDLAAASNALESSHRLTPEELAQKTDLSRDTATAALQHLTRTGMAMYDIATRSYRWRQLFPFPVPEGDESDQRSRLAGRIAQTGGVSFYKDMPEWAETMLASRDPEAIRFWASVRGGETRNEKKFNVVLDLDKDGRVVFASCTCSYFRREKLRKGPCAHILAAAALSSQQLLGARAAQKAAAGAAAVDFTGKNFVFTGALSLFTREQAEGIVAQRGGKASGSVSKNTHYLVAGEKAGSKLARANELGIPVLTEQQFLDMLEGK